MLLTIATVSPILVLIPGASLRDRATLPSPLRSLSGRYPSLRSVDARCALTPVPQHPGTPRKSNTK